MISFGTEEHLLIHFFLFSVSVVVAFFICWAPFHAQRLLAIYGDWTNVWHARVYKILDNISGVLYYFSATINPILYHILCSRFRSAFKVSAFYMPSAITIRTLRNSSILYDVSGSISVPLYLAVSCREVLNMYKIYRCSSARARGLKFCPIRMAGNVRAAYGVRLGVKEVFRRQRIIHHRTHFEGEYVSQEAGALKRFGVALGILVDEKPLTRRYR